MTIRSLADLAPPSAPPAQRLRRTAAAARVHFTWWGVHKTLTAPQRQEVGLAYDADSRLLTAGKRLLDVRHPRFRALTALKGRVTQFWKGLSLPYVEPGVRLLRHSDVGAFDETMQGFRSDLRAAEAELAEEFPRLLDDARSRLGRLFDPADYPEEVRGLFDVAWDFPSVEPPPYLMRLHPEVYRAEQERVAARFEEAVRLAEEAFAAEFAALVGHLAERLAGAGPGGEPKVFRDSAVTNLTEFFERFRRLNLRSNEDLDAMVAQAQELVHGVTPQALRSSAGLRERVASDMAQVRAGLEGLMVAAPRRRIIRGAPANGESHDANG